MVLNTIERECNIMQKQEALFSHSYKAFMQFIYPPSSNRVSVCVMAAFYIARIIDKLRGDEQSIANNG